MSKIKVKVNSWFFDKFIGDKKYIYLVSFFVPLFILLCIYIGKGVYPFGEQMYLARDMYHQYAPFFSEFYNKLTGGGSLTYSWNIGLGTNFTGLYAYYLASPINWFLVLTKRNNLIELMTIIIVVKIAFSSVTFTYYLRHRYEGNDLITVAISVFYALSSYLAAYSWNIMWLDCVMLLPLMILGLERLVKENKGYLYCITLGISILSNYYISFMICIYLVLYFIIMLISNDTEKDWNYYKSRILKFTLFSLLAGMFAACLIIPEYYALKVSASGEMNFPDTITRYFSIYEISARGLMNLEVSETTANDPNIYSTILIYLALPLYWIRPSKNTKEKIGKTLLVAFFLISFNFNILNYIWHGFHFPNSLPARQSFIFIFLVLTMSYEALINIRDYSNKHIYGAFAMALMVFLSYEHLLVDDSFEYQAVYISIFFLSLYLWAIQRYRKIQDEFTMQIYNLSTDEEYDVNIKGKLLASDEEYYGGNYQYELILFKKTLVTIIFLLIAIAETVVNFGSTGLSTASRPYYVDDNEAINELVLKIEEEDDSFYRVEKYKRRTKNDAAWHGYKGVSIFSSTSGEKLNDYLDLLGFENSMNANSFYGQTPLTSSLFSVKYMLGKEEQEIANENSSLSSLVDEVDGEYLFENLYTLPLAFMLPNDFDLRWDTSPTDPFVTQNNFAVNLIQDYIFDEMVTISNGSMVTLKVENNDEVYIYVPTSNVESLSYTVNDVNGIEKYTETYDEYKREHIISLGRFEPGEFVHVTSPESTTDLEVYAYTFNEEVFINLYNRLREAPLNVEIFEDTYIKGNIRVDNPELMYTSIPFDEGWTVKVDGNEVEALVFKDALLAVALSPGQYVVEFSYSPQGLKPGFAISAISVIGFLLMVLVKRYKNSSG